MTQEQKIKVNELYEQAMKEIVNVKYKQFIVKDLFKGYEWNELDIEVRRNLGAMIYSTFLKGELPFLEENGKNSSKQQRYIRKSDC